MLLGNFNLFRCDTCQTQVYSETLPRTWYWIQGGIGKPTRHACKWCAPSISDDIKGRPGQKYPVNDSRNGKP